MNIKSIVKTIALTIFITAFCFWMICSPFLFAGMWDNVLAETGAGLLLFFGQLYLVFLPNLAYWALGDSRSISLRLWTKITTVAPWFHRFDYKMY